jgi:hypothetical protein
MAFSRLLATEDTEGTEDNGELNAYSVRSVISVAIYLYSGLARAVDWRMISSGSTMISSGSSI